MHVGGTRRLKISPHLGYGERGVPGVIPPNSVLIVQVDANWLVVHASTWRCRDTCIQRRDGSQRALRGEWIPDREASVDDLAILQVLRIQSGALSFECRSHY